jgi:hypothetical protein
MWPFSKERPREQLLTGHTYRNDALFAVPLSSGRTQGPVAEEQKAIRAWLPAPLVWTWVRAYRQLHAGNAGLRPATTSFPFALLYRLWVKLDAAFS